MPVSRRPFAYTATLAVLLTTGRMSPAATVVIRGEVASVPTAAIARSISLEVFTELIGVSLLPISAHQVRVEVQLGGSQLSILSAGVPQRHVYAGPSSAPAATFTSQRVDSGDITFVGTTNLESGAGLLKIDVEIPGHAPAGLYPLTISPDQQFSFIADADGHAVMSQVASGGIRISSRDGDYDFDNDIDNADFMVWKSEFGSTGLFAADGNSDGVVNAADYVVWRDGRTTAATELGDFNGNGVVDAADFVVWRDTLGQNGPELAADANRNLLIDPGDYQMWRSNFGRTLGAGGNANANAVVPEPTTAFLVLGGIFAPWFRSRRIGTQSMCSVAVRAVY